MQTNKKQASIKVKVQYEKKKKTKSGMGKITKHELDKQKHKVTEDRYSQHRTKQNTNCTDRTSEGIVRRRETQQTDQQRLGPRQGPKYTRSV